VDVDVPSTIITGTLNINGEPGGSETGNSGIVSLRAGEIDRATIANTARPTFSTRVVPGTYDVYYTRTATPSNTMTPAPANHAARLHAGIVVAPGAMTTFDINIPSTTVSGRITVNGLPAGAGDSRNADAARRGRRLRFIRTHQRRFVYGASGPGDVRPLLLPRPRPPATRRR
jgi:hypothetical protein